MTDKGGSLDRRWLTERGIGHVRRRRDVQPDHHTQIFAMSWLRLANREVLYGLSGAYVAEDDWAVPMSPNTELLKRHSNLSQTQMAPIVRQAAK